MSRSLNVCLCSKCWGQIGMLKYFTERLKVICNKWKTENQRIKAGGRILKIMKRSPHIPAVTINTNGSTSHVKVRDCPAIFGGAFL